MDLITQDWNLARIGQKKIQTTNNNIFHIKIILSVKLNLRI